MQEKCELGERPVQKKKQDRCQNIHIHSIDAHSEAFADKNMFTRPFFPCQLTVCHVFVKCGAWGTGEEAHESHDVRNGTGPSPQAE